MRVLLCLVLLASLGGFGGVPVACITWQIITPDAVTFDLTGDGYLVSGVDNIGMPPVRSYTHQVPGQAGVVLDDMLDDARVVMVSHAATGTTGSKGLTAVFENMNDVMANYRYNRTLTLQPLRLRATLGAKSADLYCYYGGMVTAKVDNNRAIFGFTLVAYDPYWYGTTETTASLDVQDALGVSYILGRIDGAWTAMGNNGTAVVYCMALDAAGDLYIGGAFTNWAGIGAADYIAKYTMSTGVWSAVGTTSLNQAVQHIAIAGNGDIYIGGDFTDAGGDASADRIAVLLNGAADWTTITAAGGANAMVGCLLLTDDGRLIAGGGFNSINAVAANSVAEYNISTGVWSAMAGITNTEIVWCLAQGQDGTIYAGGEFTNASADPDADYIAYWTGAAWAAVQGPANGIVYALVVAENGALYVGGAFTTWDAQTVNYIAKWDGSAISDLDSGMDAYVREIWIDDESNLYAAGAFTTAGGVSIFDRCAIWNGNSWRALPIDLPGAAVIYDIDGSGDNVFFGFSTTGTAYVPGRTPLTYSGNVQFPPTLEVDGPGTLYHMRNETTGIEILSNLYINPGETVTFDLGNPGEIPAGKSVSTSWLTRPNANNLLGKVQTPVQLSQFALAPAPIATSGSNLVSVYMSRPTGYGQLLSNTGFETAGGGGADIWGSWSEVAGDGALANETTIVHSGADSAKFTSGATANTNIYQPGTAVPGASYRATYWIYGDGTNPARYRIYDVTNGANIVAITSTGITAASWQRFTVDFVAPAACVSIRVYCYGPAVNGGIAYFDDVGMERIAARALYYNRYDSLQAAVD